MLSQDEIQVCRSETAQAQLPFQDQVTGLRLEFLNDLRCFAPLDEELAVFHSLKDTEWHMLHLAVVFGEGNGDVNDLDTLSPRFRHQVDGVGDGLVLFQDFLDSLVKAATRRCKLILKLDQDHDCFFRVRKSGISQCTGWAFRGLRFRFLVPYNR
jgi:hypothetical protein